MNKISICTVCMNRLHHLKETLPVNIADNMDYPDLEHIILDYNSGDGMEEWAMEHLGMQISSGRVKYYKTLDPVYFNLSHSKNMVAGLGSGNIVCLIDADNYSGPGYGSWVNRVFTEYGNNAVITTLRKTFIPYRDQGGKLCFSKELFKEVKGFDEAMVGYGIDDIDLVNRLEMAGGQRIFIENTEHLKYIGHTNVERLENHHLINSLDNIYIEVDKEIGRQHILYMLNDNSIMEIDFVFDDNLKGDILKSYGGWRIKNNLIRHGSYKQRGNSLVLSYRDNSSLRYEEEDSETLSGFDETGRILWKRVQPESELYFHLVMSYGECFNRMMFEQNKDCEKQVNLEGWGRGKVFLNFDYDNPVLV